MIDEYKAYGDKNQDTEWITSFPQKAWIAGGIISLIVLIQELWVKRQEKAGLKEGI